MIASTGSAISTITHRRSAMLGCGWRRNVPRPCAQSTSVTARLAVITHVSTSASPNSRNAIAFSGNSAIRIAKIATA